MGWEGVGLGISDGGFMSFCREEIIWAEVGVVGFVGVAIGFGVGVGVLVGVRGRVGGMGLGDRGLILRFLFKRTVPGLRYFFIWDSREIVFVGTFGRME